MSDRSAAMWRQDRIPEWLRGNWRALSDWRAADTVAAAILLGLSTVAMLAVRTHLNVLNVALIFLGLFLPVAAVVGYLVIALYILVPVSALRSAR